MPRTRVSSRTTSSSESRFMRSSSTSPASTFSARSWIEVALLPESRRCGAPRTTAPTPLAVSADRRTARRTGSGSRTRPGPRAAGNRSNGRARGSRWHGAGLASGRGRRAASMRASTPDRAWPGCRALLDLRIRFCHQRSLPDPSGRREHEHAVFVDREVDRVADLGHLVSGTRTRTGAPAATTVSSV